MSLSPFVLSLLHLVLLLLLLLLLQADSRDHVLKSCMGRVHLCGGCSQAAKHRGQPRRPRALILHLSMALQVATCKYMVTRDIILLLN